MPTATNTANGGDAASGKSKKKEGILSFASDLRRRLPTDKDDTTAAQALLSEVQKQIKTLERHSDKPNHGMLHDEDLDAEGTKLWNVCTRLGRDERARSSPGLKLVLWSRVFAFHILHLCQWSPKCTASICWHLLTLSLRIAKLCIVAEDEDIQNARLVLQKAADYHGRLQDMSQTMEPEDINQTVEMEAEWTVLRIALAWRDNQLDVAEHLFAQANELLQKVKPGSTNSIIDVYFQIGQGMLSKGNLPMAEKWLQRAWDAVNGQRLQQLPRDAVELRMAIVQSLVTVLLSLQTNDSNERAHNIVSYIESEIGDHPIVLLLKLEIINRSPAEVFDSEAYGNTLRRMIRSFQPSESRFKLLAHHIRKVHAKSPGLGCTILDEFLASLVKTGQAAWIDKAVVTRVFMTTSQRDFAGSIDDAGKALSKVEEPVGADASFSAHTLIWKRIEANYSQGQYEVAEKWCQLALSPVFHNSGPSNLAKIQRKLLLCAIARNDIDSAKSTFYTMPRDAQGDPMTQYLMYKTSIRSGDREAAAEHLESVAKASPAHMHLLYACVADSQQATDSHITIDALQAVAGMYNFEHPGPVNLPALLRCTIMLLHGLLENGDEARRQSVVVDLCSVFDSVAAAAHKSPEDATGKKLFHIRELEWFCQNSYNLGLNHAGDWSLRSLVKILTACVSIIKAFPNDIGAEVAADLSLKSIFCNFLISSALVALARAQDSLERQLQDYLTMRKHIMAADSEIQKRMESQSLDEIATRDLLNKLALLLAFDFEAALALRCWQELGEIVLKASACESIESFKTMADCILRAHVPTEQLFSVLRNIINQISTLQDYDPSKLAKYTRCLFQAVTPSDDNLAGILLDEACRMARDAHGTPAAWPSEELEWMASAAYNHSIDLWGRDERESCVWWAQKAMSIAQFCNDRGHLEEMLQDKYANLKLDFNGD